MTFTFFKLHEPWITKHSVSRFRRSDPAVCRYVSVRMKFDIDKKQGGENRVESGENSCFLNFQDFRMRSMNE